MNAYVDSSVLLRIVFGEPNGLAGWADIDQAVASELIRVECLQTLDRARIRDRLDDRTVAERRGSLLEAIDAIALVAIDRQVLERAAEPFPVSLTTLDALHLASALAVRDRFQSLTFATHDEHLGLAAAAMGFAVRGVTPRSSRP
jgi:predicted nucleic acid-binding protein